MRQIQRGKWPKSDNVPVADSEKGKVDGFNIHGFEIQFLT